MVERFENEADWLEARTKVVTSSDIPALFGINKYGRTRFSVWHEKKSGKPAPYLETERQTWGKRLEKTIQTTVIEENGWELVEDAGENDYKLASKDAGIATSFDAIINDGEQDAVLEIKNVDSLVVAKTWCYDEKSEGYQPPIHIELQLQYQLLCTGLKVGYIAALIGGNRCIIVKRTPNEKLLTMIKQKIAEFWTSIEDNVEPPLDEDGEDFENAKAIYGCVGEEIKSGDEDDLKHVEGYMKASEDIKEATKRKKYHQSELIKSLSGHSKILHEQFTYSGKLVPAKEYTVNRKEYIAYRLTPRSNP